MSATDRMIRVYDRTMPGSHQRRYYENSGYFNFGYWGAGAKSQREASDALVDQLTARIAGKDRTNSGRGMRARRLDAAVGAELCARHDYRHQYFRAQIAEARRAPGCAFKVMDATQLDFPDNHFDAVICVEAAFHFDTRDKFLGEAHRVLKPGGSLVLSDILFRTMFNAVVPFGQVPRANLMAGIDEYRTRLAAAGFAAVAVIDATALASADSAGTWPLGRARAPRRTDEIAA